jgi:hypothetical protein
VSKKPLQAKQAMIRSAIRYRSQEPAFLSVSVSVQYRLPHVSVHSTILFQGCIALIAITGLLAISPAGVTARDANILGLHLGMDLTKVLSRRLVESSYNTIAKNEEVQS